MKIFVSTGEVSGDLHLSYLVEKAKEMDNGVEFFGVAGKYSEKAGVKIVQNIDDLAVMGFVEALKKYSYLKSKAKEYLDFIEKEKIEKVILVDYGGFNIKFLELLKEKMPSVEVYYYIPPKVWIWGEKRVEKIRKADHIMVIFPWEVDFYKKHNIEVKYFGNPFSERYEKIERKGDDILLLPGSRKQEICSLIPEMLKLVERNKEKNFILKLSSKEHLKWININLDEYKNLKVEFISLKESAKNIKIAIAASGTVTLELALLGVPTIVVYKTTIINYFIAKYILKVGFVSLPNLTLNEEVFPELLQQRCNVIEIEKALENMLKNLSKIEKKIDEIRAKLSGHNITKQYAKLLLKGKTNE